MAAADPHIVRWTDHGMAKAQMYGLTLADVEDAVCELHGQRRANTGSADWLAAFGRFRIAYNHPDEGDPLVAKIVTIWRGGR